MNALLTKLGVPEKVQRFFNAAELLFCYGEHFEHYGDSFHRVPTTTNLWIAGNEMAREVIVTSTAMETIAFLTINRHRYPDPEILTFLAIGNLAHPGQLNWIRDAFPKRKFTLVFGNDLLGRLADIKVGAGLHGKHVCLLRSDVRIRITCENRLFEFEQDNLSLNAFEKMSGLRTGIRTHKPKEFNTFLDQLKYDSRP